MMGNSSAELIRERLKEIRFQIKDTCVKCGRRPEDVTLMAVTKTVPAELVNVAVAEGITLLGENRAQELLEKYHAPHCAKLVLEAAEIYEKRGILL